MSGMQVTLTRAELVALGAERCKWRRRLQEVMDAKGINCNQLARLLGVSHNTVYRVMSGTLHTPCVLDWLRKAGAKEKYLCDPRTHGKEAA